MKEKEYIATIQYKAKVIAKNKRTAMKIVRESRDCVESTGYGDDGFHKYNKMDRIKIISLTKK